MSRSRSRSRSERGELGAGSEGEEGEDGDAGSWQEDGCNASDSWHKKRPDTKRMKPGDWICPDCEKLQFARKAFCGDCFCMRPDGDDEDAQPSSHPGDWICLECGSVTWPRRRRCRDCNAARPNQQSNQDPDRRPEQKPGDWICDGCETFHFSRKAVCQFCACSRDRQAPDRKSVNPGDWLCRSCGTQNFARFKRCKDCNIYREPEKPDRRINGKMIHQPREKARPRSPEWHHKEFKNDVVRAMKKRIDRINSPRSISYKLDVGRIAEEIETTGIDAHEMQLIMDKFEDRDKRRKVENPTNWVCAAIARSVEENSTTCQRGPDVELSSGVEKLLQQSVEYLNGEGGGYDDSINYDEVAAAAVGLNESDVAPIFEGLLTVEYKVNDPTAWICKAFNRIYSDKTKQEESQRRLSPRAAKLVRQSVDWLNKQGDFEGFIEHDAVARAATGLEEDDIADAFKEVSSRIRKGNPTTQICRALVKAKEKKLRGDSCSQAEKLPPWKRKL
eukprot:TRINITY_DN91383_c0_g1_i1.p1 TRINITY_DN91383_c0_g1~~TRINITY_DN91383_c0_g1_i1.p1  ORF type:complete len:503 (-),score=71.43 TRINITY_DN91383_c0_g1_i1:30-1538(-)